MQHGSLTSSMRMQRLSIASTGRSSAQTSDGIASGLNRTVRRGRQAVQKAAIQEAKIELVLNLSLPTIKTKRWKWASTRIRPEGRKVPLHRVTIKDRRMRQSLRRSMKHWWARCKTSYGNALWCRATRHNYQSAWWIRRLVCLSLIEQLRCKAWACVKIWAKSIYRELVR